MLSKNRIQRIKLATIDTPYSYIFISSFFLYFIIDMIVNKSYFTYATFSSYKIFFKVPYVIFKVLIAFLVALNINLIILKIKDFRNLQGDESLTFLGILGGLLGGACPGCFVGLFPAFMGLFGITASLGSLPFLGIEILLISLILLVLSTVLLTRDSVCKIRGGKHE